MSRISLAVTSLFAMAASFAATLLLLRGDERALPPHVAGFVPEARAGAPSRPADVPAPTPDPRDPDAAAPLADPDAAASLEARAAAAEAQEEAMRAAVFSVPDSPDATLDDKLDHYRRALRDAFADRPGVDVLRQRGLFTEVFLRNASVQADLSAMDPGSRERALEHIRREMGYTDDEIARLEEIDARRESRWQRGLAYMEERRRLADTFEGDVLEEELRHLREQYFAHEAVTIEREEARGFFRYERPRVYGRN